MSETIVPDTTTQATQSQPMPTNTAAPVVPPIGTDTPVDTNPLPLSTDLQPRARRTRRKPGEPKAPKAPKVTKEPKAPKEGRVRKNVNAGRKFGKPVAFTEWVRVIHSGRNDAVNERIHLVIDDVNNICTLVTQARLQTDSPDLEPERKQRIKFTSFEVVHGVVEPNIAPSVIAKNVDAFGNELPPGTTPNPTPPGTSQGVLPFAPPS